MKRKITTVLVDPFPICNSVNQVVMDLEDLQNRYPEYDLWLEDDDSWTGGEYRIVGYRYETDEEYQARIQQELEEARKKEERRKQKAQKSQQSKEQRIIALEKELAKLKGL